MKAALKSRLAVLWLLLASWVGPGCGGDGDGTPPPDAGVDAPAGDECTASSDCLPQGVPACGEWQCRDGFCDVVCENCQETDFDGYGEGLGCAGADCDDADDGIHPGATESCDAVDNDCDALVDEGIARDCYDGPGGTGGVGECRGGTQHCVEGDFGPCIGQIVPAPGEACNAADDDCDGQTDEDLGDLRCGVGACSVSVAACAVGVIQTCAAPPPASPTEAMCDGVDENCDGATDEDESCGCVHVSVPPLGSAAGDGSALAPLDTIDAAIGQAVSVGPPRVCVSAGTYAEAVTMANGVSVYGGYDPVTWVRDTGANATVLFGQDDLGVLFSSAVTMPTTLDGFAVFASDLFPESAAVTVQGSTGARLTTNLIAGASAGATTVGVQVTQGAAPRIARNRIVGGQGSALAAAIRSVGAAPIIVDHCDEFAASGACAKFCSAVPPPAPALAIIGRESNGTGDSVAVWLEDSPDALLAGSTVCATGIGGGSDGDVAAVRIVGEAQGLRIHGDAATAGGGGTASRGLLAENCAASAPWITHNVFRAEAVTLGAAGEGIAALGDCHPVVQENAVFGALGGTQSAVGVRCGASGSDASRCLLWGNTIAGLATIGDSAVAATGVRCEAGACSRLVGNQIFGISVGFGMPATAVTAIGLLLEATGPVVERNLILGGTDGACGTSATIALDAKGAFSRIENNLLAPGGCGAFDPVGGEFAGLRVTSGDDRWEVDVHSNDLVALANDTACAEAGLWLDVEAAVSQPRSRGLFRNNILYAGACATRHGLAEASALADPRVVENNLFFVVGGGSLYLDEAATGLTLDGIDALVDCSVANNLTGDPTFVSLGDLHLLSTSPCVDAGTASAAPAVDFEGTDRPQGAAPDVGAFEYTP
jgi:hypothetical protein